MNSLVREAIAELEANGFIPEHLRARMTSGEVMHALTSSGA